MVASVERYGIRYHYSTLRLGKASPTLVIYGIEVVIQRRYHNCVTGRVKDIIKRCALVAVAENRILCLCVLRIGHGQCQDAEEK